MTWLTRWPAVQIFANFTGKMLRQRYLVWNFAKRDLKSRYVGSYMGIFWSVIYPLVLLVCYTFVFSIVFEVRPYSRATDNFAIFLFCGILPWLYFQDSLMQSCGSIVDNGNLIRKTVFPSEILPVSLVISSLVAHLIGLLILLTILALSGLLKWTVFWIPIYLLLLMVFALGLGWLTAALQVFLRDTLQLLSVFLIFWFWFTPIFYSAQNLPPEYRWLLKLNPLAAVVEGYRQVLLEGHAPDFRGLLFFAVSALVVFILGGLVFRNTKRDFADVL